MSESSARFHLSIKEGIFEISGSELFVSQQIENFRDLIEASVAINAETAGSEHIEDEGCNVGDTINSENEASPKEVQNLFENVIDVANDKVHITATMSGRSNSEKTVNTALVYLWGKTKFLKQEWAEAKEIRQLCEEQACLDSTNFSAQLKNKKEYFLIDGVKNSSAKKYKLTKPGVVAAEALLGKLNAG